MSKAIIGAAEIAAAFAATAWVGGIGGIAALAAQGGMLSMYAGATMAAFASGISMEAGAIAQALGSNNGIGVTTRSAAGLRQIIRGEARVGGTTIYQSTSGSTKRQYNMIIALATHPCEAIVGLYLDGRQVYWQAGSNCNITNPDGTNFGGNSDSSNHIGPNGQQYNFGGEVFCAPFMGTQTNQPNHVGGVWSATGGFCTDMQANDGTWSPGSVAGAGCASCSASFDNDGRITALNPENLGYNYPAGTVSISITDQNGGIGTGASGHGVVVGGSVTSYVVDNPGYGYANPQVVVDPPSTSMETPYLGGCTYCYLKIEADSSNFPSFPDVKFTIKGKNNIWDPRTSTYGYTTNWALHIADAITDATWGLGDNTVNQAQLIAAANVCDTMLPCAGGSERQFALNWHYDTSTSPGDAISQMMDAAAGRLSRIGGQWYVWPAYWQGPSFTFDENCLIAPLTWNPKRPMSELCNRITGTFIAANYPYNSAGDMYDSNGYYNGQMQNNFPYAFQPTNYPMYACDALHGYGTGVDVYLSQDGGIYLPKEVVQPCILSVSQAQRVAKIMLLRNRQQGTGSMSMSLAAWQMQPTDVMNFNMPSLSWTNKVLEVSKIQFKQQKASETDAPGYFVELQVQETDPSVYQWDQEEELTPYDVPVITNASGTNTYAVNPPTSVTLTDDSTTALVLSTGATTARVLATWVPPVDTYVQNGGSIQVQYCLMDTVGATNPIRRSIGGGRLGNITFGSTLLYPTNWVDAGTVSGQATYLYIDVPSGYCNIAIQVRAVRSNGSASAWVLDSATFGNAPITITRPQPILPINPVGPIGVVFQFSDGTTLDTVQPEGASGFTYQRMPKANMDSNRRGLIDFTQSGHVGKTMDNVPDGSGRHGVTAVDGAGKAIIDFSQAHTNKTIDYITEGSTNKYFSGKTLDSLPDGSSYARVASSHLVSGVPAYSGGTTIDSLKPAALGADVTGANTSLNTNAVSGLAAASVAGNLNGTHILTNPDFINGLTGWNLYDNSITGHLALSVVSNSATPNSSGNYLQMTYTSGGSGITPGWGGFNCSITADSGSATPNAYHRGATIIWRVLANIPVGYSLNWASNSYGTGGSLTYLTPMAGTGAWQAYVIQQGIGTSGSFSSTGFFYLTGGSSAANWQVAVCEAIDITAPTVIYTGNNLRSGTGGAVLHDSDVITSQGTASDVQYGAGKAVLEHGADITGNHTSYATYNIGTNTYVDVNATVQSGGGIDFSSGLHSHKTMDYIPDGSSRHGVSQVDGAGKAIIDFSQAHVYKDLDHINNGATYKSVSSIDANGKAIIDFSQAHVYKNLDWVADGASRYGAAEAGANVTAGHVLTATATTSGYTVPTSTNTPKPWSAVTGLGFTLTASGTSDVYNLFAALALSETQSGANVPVNFAVVVDGNTTTPYLTQTVTVVLPSTPTVPFFASVTGLSAGSHTIQLYVQAIATGLALYIEAVGTYVICQRIY